MVELIGIEPTTGRSNVARKLSPAVLILAATELAERSSDLAIVLGTQLAPASVAELGGALRRADDVGEEDSGQ